MGSWEESFAGLDQPITAALGDDAVLDVNGDGVTLVPVRGFFDAPWLRPRLGQIRTEITEPTFEANQADIAAAIEGTSVLTVGATDYDVIYAEPDSSGMTKLILRAK